MAKAYNKMKENTKTHFHTIYSSKTSLSSNYPQKKGFNIKEILILHDCFP